MTTLASPLGVLTGPTEVIYLIRITEVCVWIYVGRTKDFAARMTKHMQEPPGPLDKLLYIMLSRAKDAVVTYEPLLTVPAETARDWEQFFISAYKSSESLFGLNMRNEVALPPPMVALSRHAQALRSFMHDNKNLPNPVTEKEYTLWKGRKPAAEKKTLPAWKDICTQVREATWCPRSRELLPCQEFVHLQSTNPLRISFTLTTSTEAELIKVVYALEHAPEETHVQIASAICNSATPAGPSTLVACINDHTCGCHLARNNQSMGRMQL